MFIPSFIDMLYQPFDGAILAHASINAVIDQISPESLLTPIEKELLRQRLTQSSQQNFLAGRGLGKYLAAQLFNNDIQDWQILSLANGAPSLQNSEGATFGSISISHSHGRVACMLCTAPKPIGIDIEQLSPRASPREILETISHLIELDWYDEEPTLKRFYWLWTAKEAVAKAHHSSIWQSLKRSALRMPSDKQAVEDANPLPLNHFYHAPTQHMGAWVLTDQL
jgi:phosphopantetheinyl transferase